MSTYNPLEHPIQMLTPLRIASSGWLEHTPFAMLMMELVKPRILVELGTYTGVSYCAFCQAITHLNIDTRSYAIDTWQGDPQTGQFSDEVLSDLRSHHDRLYGSFSRLLPMTFDAALPHFTDQSIDLLHIDGHHSYDSVRHDFDQWLPKMSARGVILFHDTNVREGDFGVWRLWEELRPRYPHFEFFHGNGLGVLAIGQDAPEALTAWLSEAAEQPARMRDLFAHLGQRMQLHLELMQRQEEISQARTEIDTALNTIQQRNQRIDELSIEQQDLQARNQQQLDVLHAQYSAEVAKLKAKTKSQEAEINAERIRGEKNAAGIAKVVAESTAEIAAFVATIEETQVRHHQEIAAWERRALTAEQDNQALRNTRSMRIINRWWGVKSSIVQRTDYRVQRGRQLSERSALMLRTEGPASVARQFGRWIRGERRYHGQNALVLSSNKEQIEREQDADYRLAQRLALPHLAHGQESESPHNRVSQRPMEEIGKARLRTFLTMGQRLVFPAQKQPRVSIVIPVFNQAHFTYLTLENILSTVQALPYEVVIVDDGSTDETGELLDRLDNVRIHRNPANSGFGESCNRGVELAQGEYVCFLNSDTLAMPGWLNTLVDTIESDPNCGAAGAKLIFPDMRLQEAGSIIWRDGSALGYGRGEAPFAPEFDYVREIDFCSAACLLVRIELFKEIGGFDPRYAPAYYEDADLCMAIRRAGHTIIFAPRAVVFHLEHATSGRERAVALQLKNREIFVEKWREELSQYGMPTPANVLRYRDSRKAKRILILDDVVPLRQIGSGFPRTRALVAALAEAGYVITYLPTTDPRLYEPDTTELQTLGVEVLYGVTDIPALIHERGGMYDIVLVSRPHNAGLIAVARAANPQALIVYDAEAVFALREARQAEVEGKPLRAEIIAQQVQDELALAASADVVLTVSRLEQQTIQRAFPELAVAIWGHAIATRDTGVQFEEREGLAFIGYLASPPNNNAVLQLIREILPHVRQELPCSMIIGGDGATPEALEAAKRFAGQISWTGFVEDLGTILDHCRVFVAPHRFAAGIPLKVIEAMAYGVPCVISPLLAEQLGVTDNVEVLVGNDSKEFGDQVVRLYRDKDLWARLRKNSYTFIEQHYNLNAMKQSLVAMLGDGEAR